MRVSHYRGKDQVIEKGRDVWGIEVKKAAMVKVRDGEGLRRSASQAWEHFRGAALCSGAGGLVVVVYTKTIGKSAILV